MQHEVFGVSQAQAREVLRCGSGAVSMAERRETGLQAAAFLAKQGERRGGGEVSAGLGVLVIVAEAMEFGPVRLQPIPGLLGRRGGVLYEAPEARAVVHFAHVGDFMGRDVVQNKWRRKYEPP